MRAAPKLALAPAPPSLGEVLDFMRLIWALHHALAADVEADEGRDRGDRSAAAGHPHRDPVPRHPGGPDRAAPARAPEHTDRGLEAPGEQGLIHRRPDPKDGRRAFLGITEKGKRIDAAGAGTVEAAVERLLARTSRSKLNGARAVLADLASDLAKGD